MQNTGDATGRPPGVAKHEISALVCTIADVREIHPDERGLESVGGQSVRHTSVILT